MKRVLFLLLAFTLTTATYAQKPKMLGEADTAEALDAATQTRLLTAVGDDPATMKMNNGELAAAQQELGTQADGLDSADGAATAKVFSGHALLAHEFMQAGNTEQANSAFGAAQKVEKAYFAGGDRKSAEDFQFLVDAGHVYYSFGKYDVALKRFASAFKIIPKDVDPLEVAQTAYKLASIYSIDGNPKLSLRWLEYSLKAGILKATDDAGEPLVDLTTDPDLATVREAEEFGGLRTKYEF